MLRRFNVMNVQEFLLQLLLKDCSSSIILGHPLISIWRVTSHMCVVASASIRSRGDSPAQKRIGKNRLLGRIPEGAALIVPDTPKIMQLSCLSQFGYDSLHSSGNLLDPAGGRRL